MYSKDGAGGLLPPEGPHLAFLQLTSIRKGLPGELAVTPAQANRFSSGFCYSSCHAIKTLRLENGITYVAETCQLQVIRRCLVSEADADETSNINMQITMVPCQHHCSYL